MNLLTPAGIMRRDGMRSTFSAVEIGTLFESNDTVWRKRTTRTAIIHWPAYLTESFYFSASESVYVEKVKP